MNQCMLEGTLKCKLLTKPDWLKCRMKAISVTAATSRKNKTCRHERTGYFSDYLLKWKKLGHGKVINTDRSG